MKSYIQIFRVLAITVIFSLTIPSHAADNPVVKIQTNHGDIYLELYPQKAPKTVANFLQYIEEDFYTNTIFHRVMSDFMIQGGGFTPTFERKQTRAPVMNEADNGLSNERGTVAMARTFDPHSATAQFYINVVDNGLALDHKDKTPRGYGYTVFGKVTKGMEVVDTIRNIPTGPAGPFRANVPKSSAIILGISHINKPKTTTAKPVVEGN
ncbi:MAG: peptidylprolyl isomerase [Thioalkalispiraceae bacterium]|jgi:cyclophilin family peptidyl-prolyl cis-trans isomerase